MEGNIHPLFLVRNRGLYLDKREEVIISLLRFIRLLCRWVETRFISLSFGSNVSLGHNYKATASDRIGDFP